MNKENNREIKFRAWAGVKTSYGQSKHKMLMPDDNGRKVKLPGHDYNEDTAIYMQYIGLKDKNGKEIYEGDIIENDGGFNKEVIFHKGVFCEKRGKNYHIFKGKNVEVIGNKFENPQLINN